jgi:hypothetical protein
MTADSEIRRRKKAVATLDPMTVVSDFILGLEPYAFRAHPEAYDKFRDELALRLGVGCETISLIGSARLGFSLNKARLLTPFSDQSDIDIVIVTSEMFDEAWIELLSKQEKFSLAGDDERRRFKSTRDNIFYGYFRPDRFPVDTELSKAWFPKLATRFSSQIAQMHPIEAWLFKSWDHVHYFYSRYIDSIQNDARKLLDR